MITPSKYLPHSFSNLKKNVSSLESFIERIAYEYNEHRNFILTLLVVIPLEIFFAGLYCYYFGIYAIKEWEWMTKPLPMVLIIGISTSHIFRYGMNRFRGLVLTALVLSLIADVILIPEDDIYFLSGLGVFLLAHVFYIIAFSVSPQRGAPFVSLNLKRGLPFFVMLAIVPTILAFEMLEKGHPKELVLAVIVYSGVLSSMGWRTAARVGYPNETFSSQITALIGVLFFMISDLLLAVNRFHTKIYLSQLWVLPTYWIAQTLIAISLQRSSWSQSKPTIKLS